MKPMRVLIVEDDPFLAHLNERLLARLGFEVCGVADTAAGAVRMAEAGRPDLVLMDVCLRGPGDGIEAACEILRRFRIRSLFLTGEGDPETRKRAAAARPLGFLTKPVSLKELLCCLDGHPWFLEALGTAS